MTRSVPTTADELRRTRSGRADAPLSGRAVAPAVGPDTPADARAPRSAVHR
ncbi:hypothetical protein GA0074696_2954 [Micromonospora purpureochromogenes]|uniref:Uncharacterized protein n=1 Tax=Micromonospora purpureochromogenes TaxID=47872 RepID=A0A1C4XZU7_9ACTN|nr:hypothetical protein [Micromonospora purpureochromogenes]SCF13886.1 hypothetical protein GA0074696_2954 [Micromonospora purpureochromogenes]